MKVSKFLMGLLLVLGIVGCAHIASSKSDIVVSKAWVRLLPPVQKSTAAYMTIENASDRQIILESAMTNVARVTEMHQMSHDNGMMKMQQVDQISVPANGKVELAAGGYHLMLIDLAEPLKDGQKVRIQLSFNNGQKIAVEALVGESSIPETKSCCVIKKKEKD